MYIQCNLLLNSDIIHVREERGTACQEGLKLKLKVAVFGRCLLNMKRLRHIGANLVLIQDMLHRIITMTPLAKRRRFITRGCVSMREEKNTTLLSTDGNNRGILAGKEVIIMIDDGATPESVLEEQREAEWDHWSPTDPGQTRPIDDGMTPDSVLEEEWERRKKS